jgi:hypothetical protein
MAASTAIALTIVLLFLLLIVTAIYAAILVSPMRPPHAPGKDGQCQRCNEEKLFHIEPLRKGSKVRR